jgi:hypothetical protein
VTRTFRVLTVAEVSKIFEASKTLGCRGVWVEGADGLEDTSGDQIFGMFEVIGFAPKATIIAKIDGERVKVRAIKGYFGGYVVRVDL